MSDDYKPISVVYPCIVMFQNNQGMERPIGEAHNREEMMTVIETFMSERNFKYYYIRTWMLEEAQVLDVGSHTEFFVLRPKQTETE